jgi:hypothetical protein
MSNYDAKLVLNAYRSSDADAEDPFFKDALKQPKRDPELMDWFMKQRAFDDVIVAKVRTIQPPSGLKVQILGTLRAARLPPHQIG